MAKRTVSVRLEEATIESLDAWAAEAGATRGELVREAINTGVENMESAPEHVEETARVSRAMAKKERDRRKGWFRNNFAKGLQKAFEEELHPAEYRQSVEPYLEEAKELGELPEELQQETGCKTYIEWCESKLEYYRDAYHGSVWSHDPIEDPIGKHGGIENAREWLQRAKKITQALRQGDHGKADRLAAYAERDGVVPELILESAEARHEAGGVPSTDRAIAKEAKKAIDNSAALPGRTAEESNN